jgi:putative hemolysin
MEVGWLMDIFHSLHDFLTYFELDDLIGDYDVTNVKWFNHDGAFLFPSKGEKIQFEQISVGG